MRQSFLVSIMVLSSIAAARADIIYQFNVNTGSISGTVGSLDFNFNPGPLVTQAATLDILDFGSDGTLAGGPSITGDVSGGPLPTTLTFDNGSAFNDYFEGFTFGSSLTFNVRLYGPAVNSPDGISTCLLYTSRTVPEPVLLCFQRKASEGPVNIRMRMSVFSVKFSFISSTMNSSESVPGFRPLGVAGGRT